MDEHEQYVRSKWEKIGEYRYGGRTRYVYLTDVRREFSAQTEADAWSAAAEYTRAHEQEIADVEEEISEHEAIQVLGGDAPMKRTIARLESIKAELLKGWKA